MCEDASKQPALADRSITFFDGVRTKRKNFYSLDSQIEESIVESEVVEAFACPTEPSIFLQIHSWKSQRHIVWVVLGKNESRRSRELDRHIELAGPRDSRKLKEPRPLRESRDLSEIKESRIRSSIELQESRAPREQRHSREASSSSDLPTIYKIKYVESFQEGML